MAKKKPKGVLEKIGDAVSAGAEAAIDAGSKVIHSVGDMMPTGETTPKRSAKAKSPKSSVKASKPEAKASKAQAKGAVAKDKPKGAVAKDKPKSAARSDSAKVGGTATKKASN